VKPFDQESAEIHHQTDQTDQTDPGLPTTCIFDFARTALSWPKGPERDHQLKASSRELRV
jgi:hypothetical protein